MNPPRKPAPLPVPPIRITDPSSAKSVEKFTDLGPPPPGYRRQQNMLVKKERWKKNGPKA